MSDQSSHGSDTGAAFAGLIGGALFIGAILYTIVVLTNNKYAGEKSEKPKALAPSAVVQPVA